MKQTVSEPAKRTMVDDPELVAINRVCKQLNALGEDQRRRVLDFIVAKYRPQTAEQPNGQTP